MKQLLQELQNQLKGTLFFDDLHKTIYATDASVYRKIPLAVAYPSGNQDIQQLVHFAQSVLIEGVDITRFEYFKKDNIDTGTVLVGIELDSPEQLCVILGNMEI